jgi:hypothetical protein
MEMQVANDVEHEGEGDYSNFVLIEDAQPHTIQRFEENKRISRDVARLRHLKKTKEYLEMLHNLGTGTLQTFHSFMQIDSHKLGASCDGNGCTNDV